MLEQAKDAKGLTKDLSEVTEEKEALESEVACCLRANCLDCVIGSKPEARH